MKIPKKIKIGAFDYEVILEDRVKKHGADIQGSHYALCQKIWIDKTYHQQQQEDTLFHEILESLNRNYELRLEHPQITQLTTLFYGVLKDNNLLK